MTKLLKVVYFVTGIFLAATSADEKVWTDASDDTMMYTQQISNTGTVPPPQPTTTFSIVSSKSLWSSSTLNFIPTTAVLSSQDIVSSHKIPPESTSVVTPSFNYSEQMSSYTNIPTNPIQSETPPLTSLMMTSSSDIISPSFSSSYFDPSTSPVSSTVFPSTTVQSETVSTFSSNFISSDTSQSQSFSLTPSSKTAHSSSPSFETVSNSIESSSPVSRYTILTSSQSSTPYLPHPTTSTKLLSSHSSTVSQLSTSVSWSYSLVEPEHSTGLPSVVTTVKDDNTIGNTPASAPDEAMDDMYMVIIACSSVVLVVVIVTTTVCVSLHYRNKRRKGEFNEGFISDDIGFEDMGITLIRRNRPIAVSKLGSTIRRMHGDSNYLFAEEYQQLEKISPRFPCIAAERHSNIPKNRYYDILPFDHSRVKLYAREEDDDSDFINACYVPGFHSNREYIAAQGPLAGTLDDFWRMVWEQKSEIIVMLTECKEGYQMKCEKYWSDEIDEPIQYGDVIVNTTSLSTLGHYIISVISISMGEETRTIKHFQFIKWPDYTATVQWSIMVDFIETIRSHVTPAMSGPMLIHCSAGVGRTGTYIAIDTLIQQMKNGQKNTIDVFQTVLRMRENRRKMVFNEQQYIFIYDCLLEAIGHRPNGRSVDEAANVSETVKIGATSIKTQPPSARAIEATADVSETVKIGATSIKPQPPSARAIEATADVSATVKIGTASFRTQRPKGRVVEAAAEVGGTVKIDAASTKTLSLNSKNSNTSEGHGACGTDFLFSSLEDKSPDGTEDKFVLSAFDMTDFRDLLTSYPASTGEM